MYSNAPPGVNGNGGALASGFYMSQKKFNALPKDTQKMLLDLRREYGIRYAQTLMDDESVIRKDWETKHGVRFFDPSPEDQQVHPGGRQRGERGDDEEARGRRPQGRARALGLLPQGAPEVRGRAKDKVANGWRHALGARVEYVNRARLFALRAALHRSRVPGITEQERDPVSAQGPAAPVIADAPGISTGTLERIKLYAARNERRLSVTFFVAGFLFDILTLGRIDAGLTIGQQAVYLALVTVVLVQMLLAEQAAGTRSRRRARA